ncbi:bifunctional metallophosphatase/5'-nucleotidase [Tenacibaculum sp. MAR_2009_124]|uniref:bifunctional metallophosphatase/5'-nucleotidase n=1 Tax=Tenacibaculum sp. MAR_2009_124 TaxID=1250059 RepID=UPI000B859D75|nr:bifunctional metallophosphatase/5'-nucleotidase [Tenacibaculum sp. MAR_2009_124]
MKSIKLLLLLTSFVFLNGCSNKKLQSSNTHVPYEFSILQLNDVYEISPIQGGKYGGMARVETVHQDLLRKNKNVLLVHAGDFLNPSLLGTIKVNGERVRGKQMVEVMNAMNFDVTAFGNHEFDLSYKDLQKRINESSFDWISSNVLHKISGKKERFYKETIGVKKDLKDTYIKEFTFGENKTLRVGFISVCIPSNPKDYVHYGNIYENIKRSYNELKPKVDIVLGLTHLSIDQDKKIAEMLPELPLIMGGHEHTNSYDYVGNVAIAKADANAKTVYIHRFKYDPSAKTLTFKSELKEINDKITSNVKVSTIIKKWQDILNIKIKEVVDNPEEVIYIASEPLDARDTPIRSIQTNMGDMITRSMSYAYNNEVDCALVNGGSVRIDDVLSGDINAIDIFRVLPYGGAVLKVNLTGALLEKVLDYGMSSAGTGAYLQRYNVNKVGGKWMIGENEINKSKEYSVAFSDYLLKGFDIPFLNEKNKEVLHIYEPQKNEIAYDIRRATITYLKEL